MAIIRDAKTGHALAVNKEGQIKVSSESSSRAHYASNVHGQAYQVLGTTSIVGGAQTVLHVKNTSAEVNLIVSFIQLQVVTAAGGTALPSEPNYWDVGFGESVVSGGTAATAINTNRASGNSADVICTVDSPVMSGIYSPTDRYYPTGQGNLKAYDMEGAWILGQNDTASLRFVSDQTSGFVYVRMTFTMGPED